MLEWRLRPTQTELRALFLLTIVCSLGLIGVSYATDPATGTADRYAQQASLPYDDREAVAGARDNITVVSGMDSPFKRTKALYAFDERGKLLHYSNQTVYGGVDPTDDPREVMVATHDYYRDSNPHCGVTCTDQYITYVNLTTGTHENVYAYNTPGYRNSNWHDVDHLGGDRYLVAGIWNDNAWVVNVSTGLREWQYDAMHDFERASGGPYPQDWTHLNDVEAVPAPPTDVNDTWYMLSLRNHDQVIFVDPDDGIQPEWTLGCDDCHDILYEQHNPDYIPRENGGPALVVSDSENDRVVEYQWNGSEWYRTWMYQDERISWPRDADRLPNGNTLITDSHGTRVFEVNRDAEIVWQAKVVNGYEAERLGTGDESAGGPSALRAKLTSLDAGRQGTLSIDANEMEWEHVSWVTKVWHSAQFVFPVWVTLGDVALSIIVFLAGALWLAVELYWRNVRVRSPVSSGAGGRPGRLRERLPDSMHVAYLFVSLATVGALLAVVGGLTAYQLWGF